MYLNSLILLTITITRNSKKAYYYLLLVPRLLLLLLLLLSHYYTFIITIEPKKHNTSRLQSNFQGPVLLPLYHTLPQTH